MTINTKIADEIKDSFHTLLTTAYFADMAYVFAGKYFLQVQENISKQLGLSIHELDARPFGFVRGRENLESNNWDAITTQKTVKDILSINSRHVRLIRNLIIAQVYELWETHARQVIADLLKKNKSEVESDLFADLKNLRHDILHNKHRASNQNTTKNKILTEFKEGDEITFNNDQINNLDGLIAKEIDRFFIIDKLN